MHYYRIISIDKGENIMLRKASHADVLHTSGQHLDPSISVPFQFLMDAGEFGGSEISGDGVDLDEEPPNVPVKDRLADYYSNVCVMSPRLLDALRTQGVDNLQSFPAHIKNSETGERLDQPYFFVNVVGIVSCANVGASDSNPLGPSYYFHELVVDPSKARGLLLFRLKESPFEIIVHERIAGLLEGGGLAGIGVEKLGTAAGG